jgi:hypothetical protein
MNYCYIKKVFKMFKLLLLNQHDKIMNPYIIIHKQRNTFHTKRFHMSAFVKPLQSFFCLYHEIYLPELGWSPLFGRADGAPSRASTSSA